MGVDAKPQIEPGKATGPVKPNLEGPTGIPGKSTLAGKLPMSASAIGDPYIEGKGACVAGGPNCFLNPTQRGLLVNAYQQEVLAAQLQYSDALTEVKLERLIQKEEELPMYFTLMLDVLGGQLLAGVSSAFKMLQGASEAKISEGIEAMLMGGGDPPATSLSMLVTGVNPDAVGLILKSGVDQTKKSLKGGGGGEKQKALDYIGRLQETAALAWEQQRQKPPGTATDGEMIVLFHSFKAVMGHTTPRYVLALKEKIDRFMKSPASIIGREIVAGPVSKKDALPGESNHGNWAGMQTFNDTPKGGFYLRDTQVAWVVHEGVALPELYYYKRDSRHDNGIQVNDWEKSRLDVNQGEGMPEYDNDQEFKISLKVEPEFIETALAKHREVWKTDPKTVKLTMPKPYVPPYIAGARSTAPPPAPPLPPAKPQRGAIPTGPKK